MLPDYCQATLIAWKLSVLTNDKCIYTHLVLLAILCYSDTSLSPQPFVAVLNFDHRTRGTGFCQGSTLEWGHCYGYYICRALILLYPYVHKAHAKAFNTNSPCAGLFSRHTGVFRNRRCHEYGNRISDVHFKELGFAKRWIHSAFEQMDHL